jgi:hypothetical protein
MCRSMAMLVATMVLAACSSQAPPVPESATFSTRSQLAGPWRHLPTPVSDQQFKQDKAYCSMMSEMAPPDEGSIDVKRDVTFSDCLRSKGYERVLSSQSQGTATSNPVLAVGMRAIGEPYARAVDAYVKGNYETAGRLMRPLAKKGEAPAQFILGYANFINLNYPVAVKWYQRAADQGYADAQYTLGEMYLGGLGVQQSNMQAYMWFSLAAANNDALFDKETRDDAAHNRDLAAAKMTTEQIAEARRLINEWKPKPEPYARIHETEQAKADAQAARQSKAAAERKFAQSEAARTATQSQTDPLGTWLRGLGAWLRELVSSLFA